MRVFLMLRGIPASGKSTFIKENKLERFTVESDLVRQLYNGLKHNDNGKLVIPQNNGGIIWETIDTMLETRMKGGELVVLDATNLREQAYKKYKKLAKTYNYRFFVVDFTPDFDNFKEKQQYLNQILERNRQRLQYKRVSEDIIRRHLDSATNKTYINTSVLIKPEEYEEKVLYRKYDLNKYKTINLYSDLHGNYTTFKNVIGEIKEDEFYILLGDYVDRGFENKEVIEWLYENIERKNMVFLQGNHERWLKYHANGEVDKIKSKEYLYETKPEIESLENWEHKIKTITKKLQQLYYFEYAGKNYLCTHSGVNYFDERMINYSEDEVTYARGNQNLVAHKFKESLEEQRITNTYNIHGHISFSAEDKQTTKRLPNKYIPEGVKLEKEEQHKVPIYKDKVYNINSRLEFGGTLVELKLHKQGVEVKEYDPLPVEVTEEKRTRVQITRMLLENEIETKDVDKDTISLTFTRDAFKKKIWNENTIQARGLFYNKATNKVVARGYQKFFNYGELYDHDEPYTETTREEMLEKWKEYWLARLEYPIRVYKKENGFLGLVTLKDNDELYFATKTMLSKETEILLPAILKWQTEKNETQVTEEDLIRGLNSTKGKTLAIQEQDTDEYAVIELENGKIKVLDYSKGIANYIQPIHGEGLGYSHRIGFAKILLQHNKRKELVEILKTKAQGRTLLFEVIDTENDRHVIKYDENKVVLLDAIKNAIAEENYLPYEQLEDIAKTLNLEVKKEYQPIKNWENLLEEIAYWQKQKGLEGLVLVDAKHHMFKLKTDYYNKWKWYRKIQERYAKRESINIREDADRKFLQYLIDNKLATKPLWELREEYESYLKAED